MPRILYLLILLLPISAAAEGRYSIAPSPVFGYDPTLGTILGAALFVYPDRKLPDNPADRYFEVMAMGTGQPSGQVLSRYRHWGLLPGTDFDLRLSASNFSESWYGEGSATPAQALAEVEQQSFTLRPELARQVAPAVEFTLFADYRRRVERAVGGDDARRLFPDEASVGLGLGVRHDTRKDLFSPRNSHFAQLRLTWLPPQLSDLEGASDVVQLEGEWRRYFALGEATDWAVRAAAGISSGEPGYLFRYALGGNGALRGFQTNRLRGRHYWLVQNELRYPLWRFISGTAFVELGRAEEEVFMQWFDSAAWSYGLGLRFGLPPDFRVKLRADVARARDEAWRLFVTFNHAY